VLLNNHKAVWGSWYDRESAQWGFACCHSTSKSHIPPQQTEADNQYPDPTVQVKQVLQPTRPSPPTPYWKHAKSTTGSKKQQKLNEQQPKPKNSDLGNAKKLSDGLNRKKEKKLNWIKQDSRRLLMKRKRERTSLKQNSWSGQRNPSRMFLRRRWVS